jgi:hypothetical protein
MKIVALKGGSSTGRVLQKKHWEMQYIGILNIQ